MSIQTRFIGLILSVVENRREVYMAGMIDYLLIVGTNEERDFLVGLFDYLTSHDFTDKTIIRYLATSGKPNMSCEYFPAYSAVVKQGG